LNQALLALANKVCVEYSLISNWSTWHNWVRFGNPPFVPSGDDISKGFITCVQSSNIVVHALRELLESTPGFEQYAELVQMKENVGRHCAAILELPESAIVLDIGIHFTAFAVPLNGLYDTLPFFDFRGQKYYSRYEYRVMKGSQAPVVTTTLMSSLGTPASQENPFVNVEYHTAVRGIEERLAKAMLNIDGKLVPAKKYLTVTSFSEGQPELIPSLYLGDAGFGWTSYRLKIDFGKQCIVMQIPVTDWLDTPAGYEHARDIRESGIYQELNNAVGVLTFDLSVKARESDDYFDLTDLVREVGVDLGLPASEFERIVDSVCGVVDAGESSAPADTTVVDDSSEEEVSDEEIEYVSDEDTEEAVSDKEMVDPI
jgi:hypothetical protein